MRKSEVKLKLFIYSALNSNKGGCFLVPTYKINKWDGTPLSGTFNAQDLQKVTMMDGDLFCVQKIMKHKGDRVLVQWKGWPPKYDSWVEKRDLLRTG